ncbi:MAG: response regulator, partial [Rhodospirillaceae bacterium]|nr:response regulator [Rhodospirillaceae bacterium]
PAPAPVPAAVIAPPPPAPRIGAAQDDTTVRVSTRRLDRLIALGGELRVAQGRAGVRNQDIGRLLNVAEHWKNEWRGLEKSIGAARRDGEANDAIELAARAVDMGKENTQWLTRSLEQLGAVLAADRKALDQIAVPLDREVLGARTIPFAEATAGFDRVVRDLARAVGKDVDFSLEGGKIEIDRQVVAAIKDPLLHLIRNAVDHGLESASERAAAGKPARGRLMVSAALRRGMVEITIADDGRGFDLQAIRAKAAAMGLPVPDDDAGAARLAFAHGFSTAKTVSDISGRGVGLDVVKTVLESQRGTVDIAFEKGKGTRFTLTVPLTLTRLHALLVSAGGLTHAFDSSAVLGLKRVSPDDLRTLEGRDAISLEDGPLPLYRLADLLGLPGAVSEAGKLPVIVIRHGTERIGVVVEQLMAEQEVMVKDLGPRLPRVTGVAGAAILADGKIALILNAADLLRTALGRAPMPVLAQSFSLGPAAAKKRLLVADDSVTTRTLVKSILEASGYEVIDAPDGMNAWQLLQEKGADLVVSDVEMPKMDGFALTEAIRGSKRLREVPVILVTALESEKDRMRGLGAGADAYLPKSTFDQTNLLQAIERLI